MEPDSPGSTEPDEIARASVSTEQAWSQDSERTPEPGGWGYRELALVVLVAVFSYLVFLVGFGAFIALTGRSLDLDDMGQMAPVLIAIQGTWSVLVLFLIHLVVTRRYSRPFAPAIGWTWPRGPWTRFAASGFSLAILIAVIGSLMPAPEHELPMEALLKSTANLVILGIFAIFLAPPFEELVFRGFLFPVFESAHGAPAAVGVTAALFSLLHGSQYGWHWPHLLLLMGVGVVFGLIRAETKSVLACAIVHAAYNATLVGGVLVARAVMGEQA